MNKPLPDPPPPGGAVSVDLDLLPEYLATHHLKIVAFEQNILIVAPIAPIDEDARRALPSLRQ